MAKLHARGRREIMRYTKIIETPDKDTVKRQVCYALMTDRRILKRETVWFKPGPYDHGRPQRHDFGWKRYKRYREGVDLQAKARETEAEALEKGFEVAKGEALQAIQPAQLSPVTLDMIVKACEADDNLGLCRSCGETAYNVEPDAREYRCASCNLNEVYGAEELLIMTAP